MSAPLDNGTYSIFCRFRLAGLESIIGSGSGIGNDGGTERFAILEVEVDEETLSGRASVDTIGVEPKDGCREIGEPGPSLSSITTLSAQSQVRIWLTRLTRSFPFLRQWLLLLLLLQFSLPLLVFIL